MLWDAFSSSGTELIKGWMELITLKHTANELQCNGFPKVHFEIVCNTKYNFEGRLQTHIFQIC